MGGVWVEYGWNIDYMGGVWVEYGWNMDYISGIWVILVAYGWYMGGMKWTELSVS